MAHKELIREIRRLPLDEREALMEASFETVLAQLSRYVFGLTQDKTEAEEIVQEAFLHFLRSTKEMSRPEIENIHAYLFRLARNSYLARWKANRRGPNSEIESEIQPSDQHLEDPADRRRTLSQRLYGILKFDNLPPNDEEVNDIRADYLIRKYS